MEKRIFEEKFNDNKNNWVVFNDYKFSANIIDGSYVIDHIDDNDDNDDCFYQYYCPDLNIIETKAYSIEAAFTYLSGKPNNEFGLCWGCNIEEKTGGAMFFNEFIIESIGKFKINQQDLNEDYYYIIKELTDCSFIKTGENETNSLKIIKFDHNIDENLYFFINDQLVFKTYCLTLLGNKTGLTICLNLKIKVDYFRVSYYSD